MEATKERGFRVSCLGFRVEGLRINFIMVPFRNRYQLQDPSMVLQNPISCLKETVVFTMDPDSGNLKLSC